MLSAARPYVCLSLLVPGQYAAVWRSLTSARVSNRGHQAAELGCGRLRRCPVIRPATDLRICDTPYIRCRTLTAAYRGREFASPLTVLTPHRPGGFLVSFLFDLCRSTFGAFFFSCGIAAVASAATWCQAKTQEGYPCRSGLLTILPAFAVLFNFHCRPPLGGHSLTCFEFLIRAKSYWL